MTEASWNCTLSDLPTPMTVGAIFTLDCEGAPVEGVHYSDLRLELPKDYQWGLKILEVQSSTETGFRARATSYTVASYDFQDKAVLTDGNVKITLNGIKFQVTSVMTAEEKKDPKPFPPEGPVSLEWPVLANVSFIFVAVIVIAVILRFFFMRRKVRKFQKWLELNRTRLAPIDQFNKELRLLTKLENRSEQIARIDLVVREFIARQLRKNVFSIKTWKVPGSAVAGNRSQKKRILVKAGRLFGELERLQRKDVSQEFLESAVPVLIDLAREYADEVCRSSAKGGVK